MAELPGYITTASHIQPRPLTESEAHDVFTAIAAMDDRIAFRYLLEGCECRAQLMIEELLARGIRPGRVWAVMVGRPLVVSSPDAPKRRIKWLNHTAPTVALNATLDGVRVIDPAVSTKGTLTLADWAAAMGTKSIRISEVPLSQAQILAIQRERALAGLELDVVLFHLPLGQAPIPEKGGSGFVIGADPEEGCSVFAHRKMVDYLARQQSQES
jgi:hypothetical protein